MRVRAQRMASAGLFAMPAAISVSTMSSSADLAARFVDLEAGEAVGAGEDFASGGRGDPGVGVTPGDVYAGLCAVGVVPFDRETVGGVLGDKPGHPWQMARAEAAEADEAYAANGQARYELRAKRPRQQPGDELGLDPVVDEQAALDGARHGLGGHAGRSFASRPAAPGLRRRRCRSTICSGHTVDRKFPTQTASLSATSEYRMRFRCREIEGALIVKRAAISPADCSPSRRSWRIWRRVGSASARNSSDVRTLGQSQTGAAQDTDHPDLARQRKTETTARHAPDRRFPSAQTLLPGSERGAPRPHPACPETDGTVRSEKKFSMSFRTSGGGCQAPDTLPHASGPDYGA